MNTHSMGLAVITGASPGIGAIYDDRLAHRGYDLRFVARNQGNIVVLADRLANETPALFTSRVTRESSRRIRSSVVKSLRTVFDCPPSGGARNVEN
jgi:short-subunit dehydrogenase